MEECLRTMTLRRGLLLEKKRFFRIIIHVCFWKNDCFFSRGLPEISTEEGMKCCKKAFTLTELLVVVIVIGVLSAVVLPKFSKVIETRKTTEAEELMAAVDLPTPFPVLV